MHHPILWGLLAAFVVSRLVFRARMRRAYGYGGGCGMRRFHRGGPMDLGAPDRHRHFGRWGRRWRNWGDEFAARQPIDVAGSLELNARQKEIYDEAIAKAKASLGVEPLAEALAAVGKEPFDRAEVEAIVQKPELVDELEHLHHSLTPEQRARLRAVTSA